MNLDQDFGRAQLPQGDGFRVGEAENRPSSLVLVAMPNRTVVLPPVIAYMLAVQNGCAITSYLCESVTIL